MYWCWWIISATITVTSWAMPAKSKSAWSVISFCVLRLATQTVFEVVDGFFNVYTDFICFFPFCRTPFHSGIGTKILFRINVNHPPTGRCCAGIITMAYTAVCFICFIVFPFHFRADKFHRRDFAFSNPISPKRAL